ncbi:class I SAM-dependent methyltransferase [Yunchengibacter salinarum]|uniref:class I SAM-dependent methyltransferase n=1 Tax=Yunchengibacter salinarum TaxID=3133399 RepID=UPI0035B60DAC
MTAQDRTPHDADRDPAHETGAEQTHFGFETVPRGEKKALVRGVFDSVADRYDVMNDLMSAGLHRLWKRALVTALAPRSGMALLDVAGGTGDISFRALEKAPGLQALVMDINAEMLRVGRQRALERGLDVAFACGDAENLPVASASQDAVTVAFGIRNVTDIPAALGEMTRTLRPGGHFLCLEFSPAVELLIKRFYDRYSFDMIPRLGQWVTGDRDSYQYLVESIRRFPGPDRFARMMTEAGLSRVHWRPMTGGVVALHSGWRI